MGSPGNRLWDLDAGGLLGGVLGKNIHERGGMQEWTEASADLLGSSGASVTLQSIQIKARGPDLYTLSSVVYSKQSVVAGCPRREGHLGAKQLPSADDRSWGGPQL